MKGDTQREDLSLQRINTNTNSWNCNYGGMNVNDE